MKLQVNGMVRDVDVSPLRPLLHVLRDELGITGPKAGCQEGGCGTCTVLVEGQPRRSCLLPLAMVEGAAVTTIEGLGEPTDLHAVQRAFHERYGSQCGYCTPGMVLATTALLERTPDPDDEDIVDALSGHLCRCTGYVKIVEAVRAAAAATGDQR